METKLFNNQFNSIIGSHVIITGGLGSTDNDDGITRPIYESNDKFYGLISFQ